MTRSITRSFRPELRVGTTAQWAASTLILREGEPGVECNSEKDVVGIKIGDGIRLWSALEYATTGGSGGGGASLSDATPQPIGTASAGSAVTASRADHVHAGPAAATSEELANPAEAGIRSWSPELLWDLVEAWYLTQAPFDSEPAPVPLSFLLAYIAPFALNNLDIFTELDLGTADNKPASGGDLRFGSTAQTLGVSSNSAQLRASGTVWAFGGQTCRPSTRGVYLLTINSTSAFTLDLSDLPVNPGWWEAEVVITTTQVPASFTFSGNATVIPSTGSTLADNPFAAGGVTSLFLAKRSATTATAQFSPATVVT